MLDFKKLDGATLGRTQFMAHLFPWRFLINELEHQAYLTVGVGGFAELECRLRVKTRDQAVSIASAMEDYLNGGTLGTDDEYVAGELPSGVSSSEALESSEDGLMYRIISRDDGRQLLAATLMIFTPGIENEPLLVGKFKDIEMARHVAHYVATELVK